MSVLLPNATLQLLRRGDETVDAHGAPVPGGFARPVGSCPGRKREDVEGMWMLGLDPDLWPVRSGDVVRDVDTDERWVVVRAEVLRNNYDSSVDWVRVTARQVTPAGVEPANDPHFAGRP